MNHNHLYADTTFEEYEESEHGIEQAVAPLEQARMDRPDAPLVIDEIRNAAAMLRHACRRGKWLRRPDSVRARDLANQLRPIIAEHRQAAQGGQSIIEKEHLAQLWKITQQQVPVPENARWRIHFDQAVQQMPLARFEEVLS